MKPTPPHIVEKLIETIKNPRTHRYSASRGIPKLRSAIAACYARNYGVEVDPDSEAVVTIGAKEGISHLMLATLGTGEVVFVPTPSYPIHTYSVVIAGGDLRTIPLVKGRDFFEDLQTATRQIWPQPKMMVISFPHNPTTEVVELPFFEKIVGYTGGFLCLSLGFWRWIPSVLLMEWTRQDLKLSNERLEIALAVGFHPIDESKWRFDSGTGSAVGRERTKPPPRGT